MAAEVHSDSPSLTRRQRARLAARQATEAQREKMQQIESSITEFLVSLGERDEALARAGQAATHLTELGESRKSIADKTGTSIHEVTRAIQLYESSDRADGDDADDASDPASDPASEATPGDGTGDATAGAE